MFLLLTLPECSSADARIACPLGCGPGRVRQDQGLAWPRLLGVVAGAYLVFASDRAAAIAGWPVLAWVRHCGRHSLEVFAAGCVSALLGRVVFRVVQDDFLPVQALVNVLGVAAMVATAWWNGAGPERASTPLPRRIGNPYVH